MHGKRNTKAKLTKTITSLSRNIFFGGLKITNVAKKYEKFGVYEWVNYFENISAEPTEIISDLWDCDCVLLMKYEANRKYCAFFARP